LQLPVLGWVVTTFTAYHFFRLSELNSDSQSFNS
jgi:hypothetical protein